MKMIKSNKRIILDMNDYGQSTSTVFDKHTGKIINIDIDNDTFFLDMTPVQQQNNVEEAIWVMPVNVVPEAEEMHQGEETFEEFIGPQPVPAAVAASSGDTAAAADADELQVADPFLGPRELKVPQRPSALEQQQHALSHVPRQPWCEVCVRAAGRDDPHFASEQPLTRALEAVPVIQWDYSFMKTHEDDRTLTVLNAYDTSGSGAGFSTVGSERPVGISSQVGNSSSRPAWLCRRDSTAGPGERRRSASRGDRKEECRKSVGKEIGSGKPREQWSSRKLDSEVCSSDEDCQAQR